jgi:hypothetical protein
MPPTCRLTEGAVEGDNHMSETVRLGDWVSSYSPGMWQVYRVLEGYKTTDPITGLEVRKTTVFSKRLVSAALKRAFKEECCDLEYVKKLTGRPLRQLNALIAENPELFDQFNAYHPKSIDHIYNARISNPLKLSRLRLEALMPNDQPLSLFEITRLLVDLGISDPAGTLTAQFVSPNFECPDGCLLYRFKGIS